MQFQYLVSFSQDDQYCYLLRKCIIFIFVCCVKLHVNNGLYNCGSMFLTCKILPMGWSSTINELIHARSSCRDEINRKNRNVIWRECYRGIACLVIYANSNSMPCQHTGSFIRNAFITDTVTITDRETDIAFRINGKMRRLSSRLSVGTSISFIWETLVCTSCEQINSFRWIFQLLEISKIADWFKVLSKWTNLASFFFLEESIWI